MPHLSLGTVTVRRPGDLIPATQNEADPSLRVPCMSIMIQALSNADHSNVGRIYIFDGRKRRIGTLSIPTPNSAPCFTATVPNAPQAVNAAEYYIDADVAGDGVDVSILRA